jgi:hypothetical protein
MQPKYIALFVAWIGVALMLAAYPPKNESVDPDDLLFVITVGLLGVLAFFSGIIALAVLSI